MRTHWEQGVAEWLASTGRAVGPRVMLKCRYGHDLLPIRVRARPTADGVEIEVPPAWDDVDDETGDVLRERPVVEDRMGDPADRLSYDGPEANIVVPAGAAMTNAGRSVKLRCQQPGCHDTPELHRQAIIDAYMSAALRGRKKVRVEP